MSKAHRGKGIRATLSVSRKDCPICKRSGIKTIYEKEIEGAKTKVCKQCNATIANKAAK
jgi:hypothetical protein